MMALDLPISQFEKILKIWYNKKKHCSKKQMKKQTTHKNLNHKPGVSLLVSLFLVSVILVFAIIVSSTVIESIGLNRSVLNMNKAEYLTEGAIEEGLLFAYKVGDTAYDKEQNIYYFTDPDCYGNPNLIGCANSLVRANLSLKGTVPAALKYEGITISSSDFTEGTAFGIPVPGTGNTTTDCDKQQVVYQEPFYYNPATGEISPTAVPGQNFIQVDPTEHPCNWGKIEVGQTVAVPLYNITPADDTTPESVKNPVQLGLTKFVVRLRTPCRDGKVYCSPSERLQLNNTNGDPLYGGDDPVATWRITGTNADETQTYVLGANLVYANSQWGLKNSIIPESFINSKPQHLVIKQTNQGKDSGINVNTILKFLLNQSPWATQILTKPVFTLSIIHSLDLKNEAQPNVSYLEYQILTNSSLPIAKNEQTIRAEAVSDTFKQITEVKLQRDSGLLRYVIQQ